MPDMPGVLGWWAALARVLLPRCIVATSRRDTTVEQMRLPAQPFFASGPLVTRSVIFGGPKDCIGFVSELEVCV